MVNKTTYSPQKQGYSENEIKSILFFGFFKSLYDINHSRKSKILISSKFLIKRTVSNIWIVFFSVMRKFYTIFSMKNVDSLVHYEPKNHHFRELTYIFIQYLKPVFLIRLFPFSVKFIIVFTKVLVIYECNFKSTCLK